MTALTESSLKRFEGQDERDFDETAKALALIFEVHVASAILIAMRNFRCAKHKSEIPIVTHCSGVWGGGRGPAFALACTQCGASIHFTG